PTPISGAGGVSSVGTFLPGSYVLSETGPSGYTASLYSCMTNGGPAVLANAITLAPGDTATCTITNDDQAASLTIVKRIVNDNGGTKVVGDFGVTTSAGALVFGAGVADGANTLKYTATTLTGLSAGSRTLVESAVTGYTAGTWSCVGTTGPVGP